MGWANGTRIDSGGAHWLMIIVNPSSQMPLASWTFKTFSKFIGFFSLLRRFLMRNLYVALTFKEKSPLLLLHIQDVCNLVIVLHILSWNNWGIIFVSKLHVTWNVHIIQVYLSSRFHRTTYIYIFVVRWKHGDN